MDETARLAARAHQGQRDKLGRPYIDHVRAVGALLAYRGYRAVQAGVLHDIVEDAALTLDDLRDAGYDELVVGAVDAVTRRDGETYTDLITRAAAHPLGRHVKLADNVHNTWPARVEALAAIGGESAHEALLRARRYRRARAVLRTAGAALRPNPSTIRSIEGDPLPCPVLSEAGLWCAKSIHPGWFPEEGHGGGHWWVGWDTDRLMSGGHYDATAAVDGRPFTGHLPADCPGPTGCEFWPILDRPRRDEVLARLGGTR
ncbi:HD domain-containing protein [Micromonospora fluostatini]|uniref:HD domain-containing protein n=1 Tax=Micromonospora fluostatini TaxID=1629071 RepID=A0ABY2DJN6_9ACTN|nr:HD domain-containing protein [Micromonospora fluostatini]